MTLIKVPVRFFGDTPPNSVEALVREEVLKRYF